MFGEFMKVTKSRQLLRIGISLVGVLMGTSMAYAKPVVKSVPKSDVSYTYAGIQYTDQNIDNYDCSQNGLVVHGSFDVAENFFAIGSYTDVSGNNRTLFNANSSIYGALSFEDTSVDYGNSDSGLILAVGLRGFFNPKLEGKVEVSHHTAFDGNSVVSAGAAYWFNPKFAATADVGLGTETSSISVGMRVSF
jgi:hypothetical protein